MLLSDDAFTLLPFLLRVKSVYTHAHIQDAVQILLSSLTQTLSDYDTAVSKPPPAAALPTTRPPSGATPASRRFTAAEQGSDEQDTLRRRWLCWHASSHAHVTVACLIRSCRRHTAATAAHSSSSNHISLVMEALSQHPLQQR